MGYAYGFDSVPETGYTPHQAAITGLAEWIEKSLYALASQSTKNNDDKIVNNIVNVLNEKTDSRAKRIVHYRGGSATATISGSSKKVNYTAPKDKNGNPKYKSTKEIFKIDECILLTGEKKEKKEEGKRAPWMEIAIKEAIKGGAKHENEIVSQIKKYHKIVGETGSQKTAWCASFVGWCLNETSYSFVKSSGSRFYRIDNPEYNSSVKTKFIKITEPIYGSIAVFADCNSAGITKTSGHVAFVFGKITEGKHSGKFAVLGGNQGDKLKISPYDCSGSIFHSYGSVYKKLVCFLIPNNYEIKEEDKLQDSDNYASTELANKKIFNSEVKTTDEESSR